MVQEGVDGVLERNRAAGESNNPTHEGAPLLVSQQTRAARASHAAATVQVKPSSTSRAAANRRFAAEHDGEAEPSGVATSPSHRHEVPRH
jgi:hypothetical protein